MANLEGFLSEFAQFESESEVRSLLDGGIPVWEIFRYQVFLKVAQHRGLLQDIGVRVGGGKISRLARMSAEAIRNTTSHNAFLAPKADVLIWGHNRRKKE
ncbi:MAG: hypothetical protein HRT45_16710, partial [Bdellovibrionales bacterium]|nr:hypothetical protein [Bdellovibrionales bacterium]